MKNADGSYISIKHITPYKAKNDGSYIRVEYIKLDKSEWTQCKLCNGTGSYFESGDLHRSAGNVPCPWNCAEGITKFKKVETRVYPKVPYYG